MSNTATLYVCTTCRAGQTIPEGGQRPGEHLLATLQEMGAPDGVVIAGVSCLSACKSGAAIALTQPGKWSYVYGQLDAGQHAQDILDGAAAYAKSADGVVPWRERNPTIKKHSLSRIPPLGVIQ